jgi:7-cyano-7-deazaguanine reductase
MSEYKHLGDGNSYAVYSETYDKTLLQAIPRNDDNKYYSVGYDLWHCHESTFLLNSGSPVAGTLKFVYPSSSECIVESKSMKLYLNSFDMCKLGQTVEEASSKYVEQVIADLTELLNTEVKAHFFNSVDYDYSSYFYEPDENSININELIDIESIEITDYNASENHIEVEEFETDEVEVYSNVLRSRCRHTKQKDTGSAIIYYAGQKIKLESLFKQIVSIREVSDFHEPNCLYLFNSIIDKADVDELCVSLLYSRRGSLDINPVRATTADLIPAWVYDVTTPTAKLQGQ